MVRLTAICRAASRQIHFTDESAPRQDLPNRLDAAHYRLFTMIGREAALFLIDRHLFVGLLYGII
jgi:hypothetical protein